MSKWWKIEEFMRQHVIPILVLLAHGVACSLAVAIVPTLLYVRIGCRQAHYSDWLFVRA